MERKRLRHSVRYLLDSWGLQCVEWCCVIAGGLCAHYHSPSRHPFLKSCWHWCMHRESNQVEHSRIAVRYWHASNSDFPRSDLSLCHPWNFVFLASNSAAATRKGLFCLQWDGSCFFFVPRLSRSRFILVEVVSCDVWLGRHRLVDETIPSPFVKRSVWNAGNTSQPPW